MTDALRTRVRSKRPSWTPAAVAALLILSAVPILLTLWWFWPQAASPQLALTVYDQLVPPGMPAEVRAAVEIPQQAPGNGPSGVPILIQDLTTNRESRGKTGSNGGVSVAWDFTPQEGYAAVQASYPKEGKRRSAQMQGRVFVWPADAAVWVVDADDSLAAVEGEAFWSTNNLEVAPRPGVAAALRTKPGASRVVFLTASAAGPIKYNKLCAWLLHNVGNGPVWYVGESGDVRSAAAEIKRRFPGAALGLAARPETARAFHDAGLKTYLVREGAEAVPGVTAVPTWQALVDRLP